MDKLYKELITGPTDTVITGMKPESVKFVIRRYDGDDPYCYAVFRKRDVKRLARTVFYGEANPIVCGLSKEEARSHKRRLGMEVKMK